MKNRSINYFLISFLFLSAPLFSQMEIDGETLYGNEWINYNQEYFKLTVTEEGIYRVTGQELENAGLVLEEAQGRFLQLFHQGKQVPMFVSDAEILESDGFIEFYGKGNKGEIDKHLYQDWEEDQLNPEYSNFSDESSYFLTWVPGSNNQEYRLSQIPNDISGNPSPEPYYVHSEKMVFSNWHLKPDHTSKNIRYSHFDKLEGFASELAKKTTLSFPISSKASNSFNPIVNLRLGSNDTKHSLLVSLGSSTLYSEAYFGRKLFQLNKEISAQELTPETEIVIEGLETGSDHYLVAYAEIVYARLFDFVQGQSIQFTPKTSNQAQYFEFENFTSNGNLILVYDVETKSRLIANTDNNQIRFKLPETESSERKVFVYDYNEGFKTVNRIEKKSFENYKLANPSYIILTSEKFNESQIREYADYRSSEIGGGYNTLIVQVEQLYDQYAYGINRNPISVRNFIQERKTEWQDLEYVFIIGKGIEYTNYRTQGQIDLLDVPFYVPTWGVPGADNLLFSEKGLSAPLVPIGRIAARDENDITSYLDKVVTHEQISNTEYSLASREWTKSILHLSGGDSEEDLDELIFSSLNDMKDTIENSKFGGYVTTFRKTSADPLQTATTTEILDGINSGKSMITFFGHSGAGTFDFSLEDVGEWQNYEKYPVILSMGCHSGNVHGENLNLSLSEDFVLTPDKGALAFIASSSTATFTSLSKLGPKYYNNFGNSFHNSAIGKSINAYLKQNDNIIDLGTRILNQQLTFHGDPAINMHPQIAPDFTVDFNSIGNDPEPITIVDQTYDINFDVVNLGKHIDADLHIVLSHFLPDGSLSKKYTKTIPAPAFRSTVTIPITNSGLNALGKNRIDIQLDKDNAIAERPLPYAEDNNILSNTIEEDGYSYFVTGSTVIPIYPPEFGIVNEPDITFIASGVNAFREETDYQIQLDTSELFESPLIDDIITLSGGTVKWNPNFNYEDKVVYYWRVTPIIEDEEDQWQNSSFIYLPNETKGWNQSHYFQFLKDDVSDAHFDGRKLSFPLEFEDNTLNLFVPDETDVKPRYKRASINLGFAKLWDIPNTGICVLLREPEKLSYVVNPPPGLHGSWSINGTKRIFFFKTDEQESRIDLVNFLHDVVEDGYHVFLNTIHNDLDGDLHTSEWAQDSIVNNNRNLFNFLESQGATQIRNIEGQNTHYGMFFTKGEQMLDEVLGTTLQEEINVSGIISRSSVSGSIGSTQIGPSKAWYTLHTSLSNIEDKDNVRMDVYGLSQNGDKTLLYGNVPQGLFDLSEVPASDFPFLELEYSANDSLNRTLPTLDFWRVYFKETPEVIYESSEILEFYGSSLEQGEELTFKARIANIIDHDLDSLLVRYSVTNSLNNTVEDFTRTEPLLGLEKNIIEFKQSTLAMNPGNYQFIAELNPLDDQQEQFHFNNYAVTAFEIEKDRLNPLLDVTFNGVHIENDAIISATPEIKITLKDENQYLFLDDINSFQVVLFHPDETREDIDLNNDTRISFIPGTSNNNNTAQVNFNPEFFEEGEYQFYTQAKDKSGNFSGDVEYRVNFQIIFENNITDVLLCPNPLSDKAFFKFSLEGKILPKAFEIRIFSIDGKIVELIQTDRLRHVLIEGVNLVPWDGTSSSGAPLASGTYFFKFGFIPDHYRNNLPERYFKDAYGSFVVIKQE